MGDSVRVHSQLKDIPLAKMRASTNAQRELRQSRVDYLASEFDPEEFGYPVVNLRDGHYWIIDGQHRIEAAKRFLGDSWETQSVTCRMYSGLSEKEEADKFDQLNNNLAVSSYDKFKVRVTAGRSDEVAVKKTVEKVGLKISREKGNGGISAVTTMVKIYKRSNAPTLARALHLTYESFGDPGLNDRVIDGIARVCERYNGALNDKDAIAMLQSLRGGIGALMAKAALLRKQTGVAVPECIAAATIDTINARKGGKKLPSWWKE